MKRIGIFIVAILTMSLTACSARYIRQAQDEFNRGARIENAAFVRGYDDAILAEDPFPVYRISLSLVNREIEKNENKLRQDRLYGTALMLKAMCLWRLTSDSVTPKTEGAEKESDGIKDEKQLTHTERDLISLIQEINAEYKAGQIVLGKRDLVMLNVLPGLRDHDRALQAQTYDEAEQYFRSALNVLEGTVADVSLVTPGSKMDIYLRFAMLSTCRAWRYAAYSFFYAQSRSLAREKAAEPLSKAENLLEQLKPFVKGDARLQQAVKAMKLSLGI